MPVNRLLLNMAVPMIVSMLVQALYNVVDSVFVAKLSEDALNAVSLAFPVQNLMISVGVGTGVGINALLSRSLGQKEQDKVDRTAMNGLLLAAISCLVFMLFGLTCGRFYAIQTDIQTIVRYGGDYLTICCGMCFGMFAQITLERILQATGRTFYTMITQATGAIINIILDPILIFGLFGFPRMEVAGAALATVIGQICGALLALTFNLRKNTDVHFQLKNLRPSASIIGGIYSVGLPSIAMQSIGSVMVFGMNQILLAFTATATAVFGVYFKLQSFVFMPIFSVNNGLISIISFNYGARDRRRVSGAIRFGMLLAVGTGIIGCGLLILCASPLLQVCFNAGAQALALGIPALGLTALSFPVAAGNIILSAAFQSLGHSRYSLVISLLRYIVLLLPVALLLIYLRPASAFLCFLITEVGACLAALPMYRHVYQSKIAVL